jgi:hypothetical protein
MAKILNLFLHIPLINKASYAAQETPLVTHKGILMLDLINDLKCVLGKKSMHIYSNNQAYH